VIGMNVEPKAILDCFTHVYRRKSDAESTTCFLDMGCTASRAFIARGPRILFARSIPIGGDHLNKATSAALKISFDEAKLMRMKLCAAQTPATDEVERATGEASSSSDEADIENSFALLDRVAQSAPQTPPVAPVVTVRTGANTALADQAAQVDLACREPVSQLVRELDLCRRYYESTFPSHPVDRLVFLGGEARHRSLCQQIAREMGLAAQLGDPLARMSRVSEIGIESGIDRRQPQPSWAVALGLSLGPVAATEAVSTAAAGEV
jgi:Tfp pilus assembly PilM family ATPase